MWALRRSGVRLLPAGQVRAGQDAALPSKARRLRPARRGAEPIETFLEVAAFEMVRHPTFAQFLTRRGAVPDKRIALLYNAHPVGSPVPPGAR